ARTELLRRPTDPKPVELMNPLAQDASLLRTHPLEGVLSAVATNVRRQQPDVRVFEICKTYAHAAESEPGRAAFRPPSAGTGLTAPATTEPGRASLRPPSAGTGLTAPATTEPGRASLRPPSADGDLAVPATIEPRWVAIALTGGRTEPGWSGEPEPVDVYDAKGLAEHVLAALAVPCGTGEAGALSGF